MDVDTPDPPRDGTRREAAVSATPPSMGEEQMDVVDENRGKGSGESQRRSSAYSDHFLTFL